MIRKFTIFILLLFSASIFSNAERIILPSPDYFKAPIRDGHKLFPDSLVYPEDAEAIQIPDIGMIGRFENYEFTNLKKYRSAILTIYREDCSVITIQLRKLNSTE